MTKRILVTLDGSKTSEGVLPYVELFLGRQDANVTVARVTAPGEDTAALAYLKAVTARLRKKGGFVDPVVLNGDPAQQIVKLAAEGAFDLLMLSTRGKTGLKRLVLGSVTEEILRHVSVPTLVVHPTAKGKVPARIRSIVVPLDGSHRSGTILPVVAEVARTQEAKVYFATVVAPTKKEEFPVEIVAQNLFQEQKTLQRQGLEVELAILYGDPATETLEFARSKGADLLAIATHGRTGLDRLRYGSVAEQLLRKSALPLLVLRTAAIPREHAMHPRGAEARRRTMKSQTRELIKTPYHS